MIPLHVKTTDGQPLNSDQVSSLMKFIEDQQNPDQFLAEAAQRRQRGIDVLQRIAAAVGAPERAGTSHRDTVFELVNNYNAFVMSIEILEMIATALTERDTIRDECERLKSKLSMAESLLPVPQHAPQPMSSTRFY